MKKFLVLGIFSIFAFLVFASTAGAFTAPTNLNIQPSSSCAVNLNWQWSGQQGENLSKFNIRLKDSQNQTLNQWEIRNPAARSFGYQSIAVPVNQQVNPGQRYKFDIQACPAVGDCSIFSLSNNSNPLPNIDAAPAVSTQLRTINWQENQGGYRLNLSWSPSQVQLGRDTNLTGWQIWRDDGQVGWLSLNDFVNADPANSWPDAISPISRHSYQLKTYQTATFCDYLNNENQRRIGNFSSALVVPNKPGSLNIEGIGDRMSANVSWTNTDDETYFEVEVADNPSFSSPTFFRRGRDQNSLANPIDFQERNRLYYLRARACNDVGGNIGCSAYAVNTFLTGLRGPDNLKIFLLSANLANDAGSVRLAWQDNVFDDHRVKIYRKPAAEQNFRAEHLLTPANGSALNDLEQLPGDFYSFIDNSPALGETYDYAVSFYYVNGEMESDLIPAPMNLRLTTAFGGWRWHSTTGWVSYSSVPAENNNVNDIQVRNFNQNFGGGNQNQSATYGVYADDRGLLKGYAWSANSGWLSFNEADLTDCPVGACQARIAGGRISGWAKFLAADENRGAWSGWLHLGLAPGERLGLTVPVESDFGVFFANFLNSIRSLIGY